MPEIKTEAKPVPEKGASAPKAPMFSGMGLMMMVVACVLCAGGPTVYFMMRSGNAPKSPEGEMVKPHAEAPAASHHNGKEAFIPYTVALDPIKMPYRDTGTGAPKRYLNVTITLVIRTMVKPPEGGGGEGGGKATPEQQKDLDLKAEVEKRKPWFYNKIYEILRGKGPEDFATNELVEQVQQQIKRAINDEFFGKEEVVEDVLFPEQNF